MAHAESAAALARRAAAAAAGDELSPKIDRRFDATALAALSRVFAREAAIKVGFDGLRWVIGAAEDGDLDPVAVGRAIGIEQIERAQAGALADMAAVAHALYASAQA